MKQMIKGLVTAVCAGILLTACHNKDNNKVLLKHVTLIDGNGGMPVPMTDILIQGDTIAAIGAGLEEGDATVLDLGGKTIMPALISAHVHVGTLKDTTTKPENYTRTNILAQLHKYEDYGIGNILVMGTDRPMLFESGLRDSSEKGLMPGARLHTAGYGFGAVDGAPPLSFAMDKVFRPATPEQVVPEMDSVAKLSPTVVKMWVDDFNGKYAQKLSPDIYRKIIEEAHKRKLRVASHLYYLSDAKQLVADGLDIIGHSIRDKVVDDTLLAAMKEKGVVYIPTLSLDEFAYIYARKPEWINDPFFKKSLEPGVYEMITSQAYQDKLKNAPDYPVKVAAFEMALRNLEKISSAGILVALGTDSGAMPLRAQGFSEHLELELMVQAGLTPLQAITVATRNAAKVLKIDQQYGTLEKGKVADFIILGSNPEVNIKNTRTIEAVYKAGKEVSKGPLAKN
ncbi:amidohydrolase precursor [Filimonas lacunae]|nr:amidohydrolase precursor [Filimonas lacunae]